MATHAFNVLDTCSSTGKVTFAVNSNLEQPRSQTIARNTTQQQNGYAQNSLCTSICGSKQAQCEHDHPKLWRCCGVQIPCHEAQQSCTAEQACSDNCGEPAQEKARESPPTAPQTVAPSHTAYRCVRSATTPASHIDGTANACNNVPLKRTLKSPNPTWFINWFRRMPDAHHTHAAEQYVQLKNYGVMSTAPAQHMRSKRFHTQHNASGRGL